MFVGEGLASPLSYRRRARGCAQVWSPPHGSGPRHGPAFSFSHFSGAGLVLPLRLQSRHGCGQFGGSNLGPRPPPGLLVRGGSIEGNPLTSYLYQALSLSLCHLEPRIWNPNPRAESQELPAWQGQGRGRGAHLEPSHCCLDTNSVYFPHQPSSHSNHWLAVS